MRSITEYFQERAKLARGQFLERYNHSVLVHQPPVESAEEASFRTMHTAQAAELPASGVRVASQSLMPRLIMRMGLNSKLGTLSSGSPLVVYPVQKRQGGVFQNRITVGRTRTCDVYLPYPKVSKLHAYINQEGTCHYLADAGSTNGTSHNGRKLEKDQQVELVDGSVLQFSTFQFIYYTPLAFYNVLFGA